jgi:hypothetical protein
VFYLFSDASKHLYVGRSDHIRRRYKNHTRPSAGHNQAVFAFLLARRETGRVKPSYKAGVHSRVGLLKDPIFSDAFARAKEQIAQMDFRYIGESDPTTQCLLEIFIAVSLGTPFNDFGNH